MAAEDIDAIRPLGTFWRELVAANEPRRHGLCVEVVPVGTGEEAGGPQLFWRLLGDLVADVLLDGVEGPWGTTSDTNRETLAS
jgi:hypothetical protein